jgi:pentose-5-phosphate-3-epimerase
MLIVSVNVIFRSKRIALHVTERLVKIRVGQYGVNKILRVQPVRIYIDGGINNNSADGIGVKALLLSERAESKKEKAGK